IFLDALLWKIILLKQAALPLVFFGLMRLFVDDRETLSITTLMIAMPSAVSNVAFIKSSGADASLAARVVVSTTCAALPLLGFFLWLTTL
ncbi:MAG: hypothetical protein LBD82_06260, partial [Deltaproteobacteria bacterium]|nr:hypothetical protein [Deltaproteobacteria bacterium]